MAGCLALALGNLVSQCAWAFAGLSVTVVVGAYNQLSAGTAINYFLDGPINCSEVLFTGVACFLIVVFLGAAVHSSNAKDDELKLKGCEAAISEHVTSTSTVKPLLGVINL
ncbi:hypothetical protein HU200_065913 [Digitaria exilis]|uniref:Uncharacterized protein n=1 Tax=Digitaria exilis TaxID=1010633 RepID=A0A834ZZE1_9POAL|nr:hypothetical protein HU200_065913 [Digitaria exilis]